MPSVIEKLGARVPLEFRVLYRQFLLRVVDLDALSIEADVPRFLGQFAGVLIMISCMRAIGTLFFPPAPSMRWAVEQSACSPRSDNNKNDRGARFNAQCTSFPRSGRYVLRNRSPNA